MSSIEDRIAQLESIEAIRRVEAQYCDHWDSTRPEAWAGVFTEDGVFRRSDVDGVPGHVKRGRAELADFCRTLQQGYGRFHMLNTISITVGEGGMASSRIGFQCVMTSTGDFPKASLVTGYYDTQYRLVDQHWLIETKVERQVFRGDNAYFGVYDAGMPLSLAGGSFSDAR